MKKVLLVSKITMSKMVEFLNDSGKKKQSGEPFTVSDVQSYVRRGSLPKHMGGNIIEKCNIPNVKLYNIVE